MYSKALTYLRSVQTASDDTRRDEAFTYVTAVIWLVHVCTCPIAVSFIVYQSAPPPDMMFNLRIMDGTVVM